MKRHVLPLVAVLLFSSCIEVRDFGAYWDKGFVDPDSTLSDDLAAQRNKDNNVPSAVRTLEIGNHLFIMERLTEGKPEGMMSIQKRSVAQLDCCVSLHFT
jgi:hypothetical protein